MNLPEEFPFTVSYARYKIMWPNAFWLVSADRADSALLHNYQRPVFLHTCSASFNVVKGNRNFAVVSVVLLKFSRSDIQYVLYNGAT